jgi:hypothetical protein
MNIEEESFRGALVETGDLLGHFHSGETNRRPPGTGRMPWPEIFGALREINYQGAVTMEPFLLPGGEVGRDVSVYRVLPGADNRDEEATRSVQFVFRDEQGGGIDDATVHRVFSIRSKPKTKPRSSGDDVRRHLGQAARSLQPGARPSVKQSGPARVPAARFRPLRTSGVGARTWCALSSIRKSAAMMLLSPEKTR